MKIEFTLNGEPVHVEAPASITLLHLLREHLGLTGSKPGCEVGECGACSVMLDGRVVNSCQLLAPQVAGREVVTIEGIHAPGGGPNDLQLAFLEFGAVQCGYCTPGMVVAAEAFLARHPKPSRAEIREAISGNLCRCTGYQQIVDAVEATAARRRAQSEGRGQ
ncbi:MAG: (2Fe-2S)-binding protein [Anaerolineae bacterium]|nr:(2Fe-2S)-binding protein [Anaerolineae bacterium]